MAKAQLREGIFLQLQSQPRLAKAEWFRAEKSVALWAEMWMKEMESSIGENRDLQAFNWAAPVAAVLKFKRFWPAPRLLRQVSPRLQLPQSLQLR
jgi:hypothetical protein